MKDRISGFTLVEMSIVMVIIGLMSMTVYPALSAARTSQQKQVTETNLAVLMRAAGAYLQAHGCLPCPSPLVEDVAGFGFVGGQTDRACGVCPSSSAEGIAPFVSLGLPERIAKDGWGRWIRMRVDPALAASFDIAPPTRACTMSDVTNGVCEPDMANASAKGLCTAHLSQSVDARPILIKTNYASLAKAALLFVSHGENGYGAPATIKKDDTQTPPFHPFPSTYLGCAAGGNESCNANDAQASPRPPFVDQGPVISNTNGYDDTLIYMDRNALVAASSNASCQTEW